MQDELLKWTSDASKFQFTKRINSTFAILLHFCQDSSAVITFIRSIRLQICKAIAEIDSRSKLLTDRYRRELKLRKKYFNELVELKGNIRVYCRVRPTIKEDGSGDQAKNITEFDSEDDGMINVEHRGNNKAFEVDKVFRPASTQEEVC